MSDEMFPTFGSVVLDTTDARGLAEFYRRLLGLVYRPGDEPLGPGEPDGRGTDWLVLRHPTAGWPRIAFQQVAELARATWPDPGVPQQLHLDLTVPDAGASMTTRAMSSAAILITRSQSPTQARVASVSQLGQQVGYQPNGDQ